MGPIDQHWTSFSNIDPESDHANRIHTVIDNANLDYLCTQALQLRQEQLLQKQTESLNPLACTVDPSKFASGACNVVIALNFSDGLQWVARIQLPVNDGHDDESVTTSLLSEVVTMQLIRARSTIPIPTVFGYDASTKNIGYRYILMEALRGHVLTGRMLLSVPNIHQEKFISQLAGHLHDLSTIRFSQIGRLGYSDKLGKHVILPFSVPGSSKKISPKNTSFEFFYQFRKEHTNLILRDHMGDQEWEAAARLLERSVMMMITEENINGPFPLCHIDLHYNNILVDDEYNITGFIDWSHAQTMPIERFAIIPELVIPPAAPVEIKKAIASFREMFVKAMAKVQIEREGLQSTEEATLSHLFASSRSELIVRCTYSYPWRAVFDAQLILPLLYGPSARWVDFQRYYSEGSL
ncbi:hypothetical protein N7466_009396 [Penicillium verhagenii]|uniref:uncharacterized protein n=1 Tax=Penicillium verhagenii TaxID=1562060 RepID=UPI0025452B2E|nr:uncharacterized protein N7466_009396 [Penicillium verhagenii]KAJ5921070.1 hypothetical protein N7466_009396 [Penicillium verhagenii]